VLGKHITASIFVTIDAITDEFSYSKAY